MINQQSKMNCKTNEEKEIHNMIQEAKCRSNKNAFNEAYGVLNKCLRTAEEYYPERNHVEILKINEAIADLKFKRKDYEGALEIYTYIVSQSYSKKCRFLRTIRIKEQNTIQKISENKFNKLSTLNTKVDDFLKDAGNHIIKGDYAVAMDCLQRATRASKMLYQNNQDHNTMIKKLTADIYYETGEVEKAVELYKEAISA